ncbi:MAG: prolipoprotein diacylglyceryl transferase family protein [Actinomycetota bacterium]
MASLAREVVTATCWVEPVDHGDPCPVTIQFSGRRVGATGKPRPGDRFSQRETAEIVPGSGPVSITTVAKGINAGDWVVTSRSVEGSARAARLLPPPTDADTDRVTRLLWPWRYQAICAARSEKAKTALLPLAPVPGVIPLAYSVLIALGILVGLTVQAVIVAQAGRSVAAAMSVSVWAVLAGLVGAKLWYVVGHRGRRFNGWCIQGFIFGAAIVASVLAPTLSMPVGTYLDSLTPGLLIGMGIGRIGCFFAGCCRGRPTASRWGVWSSDQRVGAHRFPAQLFESTLCLVIGLVALILVVGSAGTPPGAVFVGAVAAYTFGRQFLLPLRADPRHLAYGRTVVLAGTALLLAGDLLWSAHA